MPSLHFTDIAVARLSTPDTYYDDKTPAFGIRIGKNRKTWFVIRGKERLRTTIGRYPEKPLAEARKEAKALLSQPVKKQSRINFGAAYELWKVAIETKKPRTQKDYKRLIERHFLPTLKSKNLPDLEFEDITGCVEKVPKGEANHALAVARIFLRWCVRPPRRYIPHNPLEGIQIEAPKKRKRVLEDKEIPRVWRAAEAQGYPYGSVVKLLLATGQRRGEIANLRWPWINEKERLITLPDWLTKNKKEHVFPYGDTVAAILETIPRLNSTDLLFPSRVSDERPFSGWGKFKQEFDAITEGVSHYTLHDLRRTYRTVHGQIGTPSEIGERLINHAAAVTTDVEEIYDRWTYIPQMRKAVDAFEAHFTALLAA
jgi:integrase